MTGIKVNFSSSCK